MPLSIEIDGVQHGWASATVRAGDKSYRMDGFSYTTDAFADLLRFGVDVALDAFQASVLFDGEPSGWAWSYDKKWDPRTGIISTFRIEELQDVSDPATQRHEALATTVDCDVLARAILDAMTRVRGDKGIEGFEADWMQAFPVRQLAALKAALAEDRRRPPDLGSPVGATIVRGDNE